MYTNKLGCFVMIEYTVLRILVLNHKNNVRFYGCKADKKFKEMDKNYKSDPQYK